MIYVINGRSALKTNKDIIQYINSHKDKKYIILVDNTAQARTYQKKLEIDFVRIEREYHTDGSLDTRKFSNAIQNNRNILMSYNYLPYVYNKLRWKLEFYTLFIMGAKEPYIYTTKIFLTLVSIKNLTEHNHWIKAALKQKQLMATSFVKKREDFWSVRCVNPKV